MSDIDGVTVDEKTCIFDDTKERRGQLKLLRENLAGIMKRIQ